MSGPAHAGIRFGVRAEAGHALVVADIAGERTDGGCQPGCGETATSAWGTCQTAATAMGSALLAMLARHDQLGYDRPFLVTVLTGPTPTVHRIPRDMLGHDIRPQPWATGRAIQAAVLAGGDIDVARSDQPGDPQEDIRIAVGRDPAGTTHLYRTGIRTTGHQRRISVTGLTGGPLCLNGPPPRPCPDTELGCADCYDAADRTLGANGWIIADTVVRGDGVGLAVLAALANRQG